MALHEIPPAMFRGPLTWLLLVRQAPINIGKSSDRAWMTVILERETELILGQDISLVPSNAVAGKLLRQTLKHPLAGPARRPTVVVVESKELGDLVSGELGLEVRVSATPLVEGDRFFAEMKRFLASGGLEAGEGEEDFAERSYFDDNLSPAQVKDLIVQATALAKLRPWDACSDADLIRLDVPDLGVAGAGLCVIGAIGEALGFVIFGSQEDYLHHVSRADLLMAEPRVVEPGVPLVSLNFDLAEDISETMQEEAAGLGLKPGRNTLYPYILCMDPEGVQRPASEADYRLVMAATVALTDACRQLGGRLADPNAWPIRSASIVPGIGAAVLTLPYEATAPRDALAPAKRSPRRAPKKPRA